MPRTRKNKKHLSRKIFSKKVSKKINKKVTKRGGAGGPKKRKRTVDPKNGASTNGGMNDVNNDENNEDAINENNSAARPASSAEPNPAVVNNVRPTSLNNLPTEIDLVIFSFLSPVDYINMANTNSKSKPKGYYNTIARDPTLLKQMARFWKRSKKFNIGRHMRDLCDRILDDHHPEFVSDPQILDHIKKASIFDPLFHILSLTIPTQYVGLTEQEKLAILEDHFTEGKQGRFIKKLIDESTLIKLSSINRFIETVGYTSLYGDFDYDIIQDDMMNLLKFINTEDDISKYHSIRSKLLAKFLEKVPPENSIDSSNLLLFRAAFNCLANPDLNSEENIELMVRLFGELLSIYIESDRVGTRDRYIANIMSVPIYMCRILLELLGKKEIIFDNVIIFFSLPGEFIISDDRYGKRESFFLSVKDYTTIGDFTEEKFRKFLTKFTLTTEYLEKRSDIGKIRDEMNDIVSVGRYRYRSPSIPPDKIELFDPNKFEWPRSLSWSHPIR